MAVPQFSTLRQGLGLGIAIIVVSAVLVTGFWLLRARRVYSMEVSEFSAELARDPLEAGGLPEKLAWDLAGVGRQRAWLIPGDGSTFAIVIHGSPGTGLTMLQFGRDLAERGLGVLLLDLPGHGGS